jgi:apolipoprotein N-acyltransferase
VLAEKPDVLLWPEAAVPGLLRYDSFVADAIGRLAQENRVWMIIGADDAEPDRASPKPDAIRVFNSSFLISPEGRLEAKYDKRQLVIFGEYIPLIRWLPFLKWFTPIEGGFADGDRVVPFAIGQPRARTAVLICFEDVFPHLAREYVDEQTDFLVNLTNDGWFSESAAQWQQAAMAVFRAIENGVPLVRCTNNGLTCWIDECGRLDEDYFRAGRDIYGEGTRIVKLPLLPEGGRRALTFYTRHGDVFGWACVALMALRFAPMAWRALRTAKFFRRAAKA